MVCLILVLNALVDLHSEFSFRCQFSIVTCILFTCFVRVCFACARVCVSCVRACLCVSCVRACLSVSCVRACLSVHGDQVVELSVLVGVHEEGEVEKDGEGQVEVEGKKVRSRRNAHG